MKSCQCLGYELEYYLNIRHLLHLDFLDGYPASFCSIKSNFRSCSSHFGLFPPFPPVAAISEFPSFFYFKNLDRRNLYGVCGSRHRVHSPRRIFFLGPLST